MTEAVKTPWHLWVIGGVSLLWNAFGAFDYVMTETRNADYLAAFTPEQLAYFESFPFWMVAFWALGVWGAVAGSALLLLRSRWAETAFWVSLLGIAVTSVYSFFLADVAMTELIGPTAMIISVVIIITGIALLFYARTMKSRGVLR